MIFSPSWQLDLSWNQLCGLELLGRGTYNAEGIKAIADALRVTGSLTSINLAWNDLGAQGAKALVEGGAFMASLTSVRAPPELQPMQSAEHFL